MAATMMIPEDGNAPSTFCRFASRGESSFPMFSLWRFSNERAGCRSEGDALRFPLRSSDVKFSGTQHEHCCCCCCCCCVRERWTEDRRQEEAAACQPVGRLVVQKSGGERLGSLAGRKRELRTKRREMRLSTTSVQLVTALAAMSQPVLAFHMSPPGRLSPLQPLGTVRAAVSHFAPMLAPTTSSRRRLDSRVLVPCAEAGGSGGGGGGIRCDRREGDPWWRGDDDESADDEAVTATVKIRFLIGEWRRQVHREMHGWVRVEPMSGLCG